MKGHVTIRFNPLSQGDGAFYVRCMGGYILAVCHFSASVNGINMTCHPFLARYNSILKFKQTKSRLDDVMIMQKVVCFSQNLSISEIFISFEQKI